MAVRLKEEDYVGKYYNDLQITAWSGKALDGHRLVECTCKCGVVFITELWSVTSGGTKSCGCSHKQANRCQPLRKDNTSGVKGVCWDKRVNKWRAAIKVDSKQIHIGNYTTLEAATEARKWAEGEYWGLEGNDGKD